MPRSPLFDEDADGRTSLFTEAEAGRVDAVDAILSRLAGTGMCPERLSLIDHKDKNGDTAIDVAKRAGHKEVAELLASEKGRMEFFG
ncbi:MAG: hypothetical protein ACR2RV_24245 [Verrucomicrobiales bacterium]